MNPVGDARAGGAPGRARRSFEAPPLHTQVFVGIEQLALAWPLGDHSPFPTEAQLAEHFGVSRGTVRHATGELVRRGLLRAEVGRGTFVDTRAQVRRIMCERLVEVGRPDSRFDFDITQFVPDFEGRDRCDGLVRGLDVYRDARTVFIAPDNSLEVLRRFALDDGKAVIVPTYGMRRGMVLLRPDAIAPEDRRLAATLDGMEALGHRLTLDEFAASGPVDLIVTGAVAMTRAGAHVGGGQAYFDLNWAILAELDLVVPVTTVVCVVHDCQVIDADLVPGPLDVTVDVLVTPSGVHATRRSWPRPDGIAWDRLDPDLLDQLDYFEALHDQRAPRPLERNNQSRAS